MFDYTYPHTNLSDINLDWFLKRFTELEAEFETIKTRLTQAEADIERNRADIAAIRADMNNLIAAFEQFRADINAQFDALEAQINARVDAALADLQAQFNALRNELNARIDEAIADMQARLDALEAQILADFDLFRTEIRAELVAIRADIDNFKAEIRLALENTYQRAKAYTDGVAAYLQDEIDELADIGVHTDVTDPTDLIRKHLQIALDRMHEYLKAWALRAIEYDGLELSAIEYDNLDLIAYEYDYRGRWHLIEKPAIYSHFV